MTYSAHASTYEVSATRSSWEIPYAAHIFSVKMSELDLEFLHSSGLRSLIGYPEAVYRDEAGVPGVVILMSPGHLAIPLPAIYSWKPCSPESVLSYSWRHFAHGGGWRELVHFFSDEFTALDRVARGLEAWPRHF